MADLISQFKECLDEEFGDKPIIATLATVEMTPAGPVADARSVVVRGVQQGGSLHIVSDRRSKKNEQLRENRSAVIVLWLPNQRVQYRIHGNMWLFPEAREKIWRRLSDSARALFFWPAPGEVRVEDSTAFPSKITAEVPTPDTFEFFMFSPRSIEALDLGQHPHRRERLTKPGDEYLHEVLNP